MVGTKQYLKKTDKYLNWKNFKRSKTSLILARLKLFQLEIEITYLKR